MLAEAAGSTGARKNPDAARSGRPSVKRGGTLLIAVGAAAAIGVQLAQFYLRLGWFWPLPWLLGAVAVGALAYRQVGAGRGRAPVLLLGLGAYAATLAATERFWFQQRSLHAVPMTWEDLGPRPGAAETEVRFRFVDHPEQFVGGYSNALARELSVRGRDTVFVTFRVSRDLRCLRGYHPVEIEGRHLPPIGDAYAGRSGGGAAGPGPWGKDPPWCP